MTVSQTHGKSIIHEETISKRGPERHLDRFVPHNVCDLMILPSETFHADPVLGKRHTLACVRLLFPLLGAIAPQVDVHLPMC